MGTFLPLCEMDMIEASFGLINQIDHAPKHGFVVRIKSDGFETCVHVTEAAATRFSDELEVLAAVMRARVLEAHEAGET